MKILSRTNPLCLKFAHSGILSQVLFFLSFWGFTAVSLYADTTIRYDNKDLYRLLIRIGWICVYLAAFNILFFSEYRIWHMILFLAIGSVLFITYKNASYRWFFQSFVILLSARRTDWKKLIRYSCIFYGLLLYSIYMCNRMGLITGLEFYRGDRLRDAIGFIQPNLFGAYLMVFALTWIAARYEKLGWLDYAVVVLVAVCAWVVPNSRTASMILVLALIAVPIMVKWGGKLIENRIFQALCLLVYPVCFAFSLVCSWYYDESNRVLYLLDKFLTGRFALAHGFLEYYPITWMGQKLKLVSTSQSMLTGQPSAILDNAYMRLLVNVGIVTTVLALVMLMSVVLYAIRTKNQGLLLGICLFAVYGLTEFRITKITANIFLIAFCYQFRTEADLIAESKNSSE